MSVVTKDEAGPVAERERLRVMVLAKLEDVMTPGFAAMFTLDEAALAGAFSETALGELAASDSTMDLLPLFDIEGESSHE